MKEREVSGHVSAETIKQRIAAKETSAVENGLKGGDQAKQPEVTDTQQEPPSLGPSSVSSSSEAPNQSATTKEKKPLTEFLVEWFEKTNLPTGTGTASARKHYKRVPASSTTASKPGKPRRKINIIFFQTAGGPVSPLLNCSQSPKSKTPRQVTMEDEEESSLTPGASQTTGPHNIRGVSYESD
jgi:hypothetical protein